MKKTLSISALILLGAMTMTQISLAVGPSNPPPSPNLPDATFNYVTANTGGQVFANNPTWAFSATNNDTTGAGLYKGAVQGTSVHPNGIGVFGQNTGGVGGYGNYGYATAGVGVYGLSSSSTGVAGVSTSGSGVSANSTNGNALTATSTNNNGVVSTIFAAGKSAVLATAPAGSNGVYGTGGTGVQGLSSSDNSLVQGGVVGLNNAVNGIGVYGYNSSASAGTGSAVYGYSLRNNGIYGYSNSGTGVLGAAGTSSATAAKFTNTAAGSTVNIGSNTYALDVTGTTSKLDTDLDVQGKISNSSTQNAGYVRYGDNLVMDPGYGIYTSMIRGETYNSGTNTSVTGNLSLAGFPDLSLSAQYASGGLIKLNSALAGVTPNSVTVRDSQGFAMENSSGSVNPVGTQTFTITENGELNTPTATPVTIRDNEGFSVKNTFATQTFFSVDGNGQATFNGPSSMWANTVSVNTSAYGGAAVDADNSNASSGYGIRGSGTTGVSGSGSVSGVSGSASGTGTGVVGTAPSSSSGKAGLFFNGLYTTELATPSYAINASGPVYANSTASGSSATMTAYLGAGYNGNALNAYTYNPGSFSIYAYNGGGNYAIYAYSASPSTAAVYVGGGGTSIYTSGNNKQPGGGSWLATSDIRLKDVHSKFTRGLGDILTLEPIKYNYKKDNPEDLPSDKEYVGLSAQEVEKVIPEAVSTDNKGYLQISNDPIIWTMLNAIKELAGKDDVLKQENAQLKAKVENLEQRLNALEAKLN